MVFSVQKRIIFATILTLTLVMGGFWFFNKSGGKKTAISAESPIVATAKTIVESPDSDSDDLKNWEEKLWGTNPNNSDTDMDGTLDGEEIKLNRDPLVKGPNDNLNAAPSQKQESAQESPLNLTQKTTRDLFVSYIQQRNSGINPQETADQILKTIANGNQTKFFENSFSLKDIKVVQSGSSEARAYINDLAEISGRYSPQIKENELTTLTRLIQYSNSEDNFKTFNEFESYAEVYKNAALKIAELPVPQNYVSAHLEYLNALNNLSKINSAFSKFVLDPITGLDAVGQYLKEAGNIKNALLTTGILIRKEKIIFQPDEAGFALISLIITLQ